MAKLVLIHTPQIQNVRVAQSDEQERFFSDVGGWKYRDDLIGPDDRIVGYVGIYE